MTQDEFREAMNRARRENRLLWVTSGTISGIAARQAAVPRPSCRLARGPTMTTLTPEQADALEHVEKLAETMDSVSRHYRTAQACHEDAKALRILLDLARQQTRAAEGRG